MDKSADQPKPHTHRRHRHRPWYKKLGQAWQDLPVTRKRKYMKFLVGVIVCLLSILLGTAIVYIL